jgi:hypothetical protein
VHVASPFNEIQIDSPVDDAISIDTDVNDRPCVSEYSPCSLNRLQVVDHAGSGKVTARHEIPVVVRGSPMIAVCDPDAHIE